MTHNLTEFESFWWIDPTPESGLHIASWKILQQIRPTSSQEVYKIDPNYFNVMENRTVFP